MIISNFTTPELDYLVKTCNFVGYELCVFELRSQGETLEEIAEFLHITIDQVKKLSRKVNKKIIKNI